MTVDELLRNCHRFRQRPSVAMAERIAGSEEAFVEKMNEKAKELGLKNTVFIIPPDCLMKGITARPMIWPSLPKNC